jgi:succinate dehydrogenase/fumarate reductase flavoprotein subunit
MSEKSIQMHCDVLVVGSGAGGLSAAVTAAHQGLKVIVLEKEAQFGGTSAWSGGKMWIPRNFLAIQAGFNEPIADARNYIAHELGEMFDAEKTDVYLENAKEMLAFFQENTALDFIAGPQIPDIHSTSPGAANSGRTVSVAAFDGAQLGPNLQVLKPPLHETTVWGMGIAAGDDAAHFYKAHKSLTSLKYVFSRLNSHFKSRLKHGRGSHLVAGNALVAGLAKTAFDLGVDIRVSHAVSELISKDGRVVGAKTASGAGAITIVASHAVVLASGGFAHDRLRKLALIPRIHTGDAHWSAAPVGNTGDGIRLAESVGAQMQQGSSATDLAPVSLVPRQDGSYAHFPHLHERGKPGVIAVNRLGHRFSNEANSAFDFMKDLLALGLTESWLVCDHNFIRRWGLGAVKPAPMPMQIGSHVATGYLIRARSIKELAKAAVIEPNAFMKTIERFNEMALRGVDEDFRKGETPYSRAQGDAQHRPNPCMAPIVKAPFYAIKLFPGSLGTFAGLKTNSHSQVLNEQNQPIAGLYACGNDMASLMAGHKPSDGISLGAAMTFGYISGKHLALAANAAR